MKIYLRELDGIKEYEQKFKKIMKTANLKLKKNIQLYFKKMEHMMIYQKIGYIVH